MAIKLTGSEEKDPKTSTINLSKPSEKLEFETRFSGETAYSDVPLSEYEDYFNPGQTFVNSALDKERAIQQSGWEQGLHALRAVPNAAILVGQNMATMLDAEKIVNSTGEVDNALYEELEEWKQWVNEKAPIYRINPTKNLDLGDSAWWFENASGLAESIGAFAISGYATGAILGRIATGLTRGSRAIRNMGRLMKGSPKLPLGQSALTAGEASFAQGLGGLSNAVAMNHMEGYSVAFGVYNDVYKDELKKGKTEDEAKETASQAAASAYNVNRANIIFNISSASAFIRGAKSTERLLKGMSKREMLKGTLFEGAQEFTEEEINLIAEKYGKAKGAGKVKDIKEYLKGHMMKDLLTMEGLETGLLGMIGGIGQTGATHVMKSIPAFGEVDPETGEKMSTYAIENKRYEQQQQRLETLDTTFKNNGLIGLTSFMDKAKDRDEQNRLYQEALANNDKEAADNLSERFLENLALEHFEAGTTGRLKEIFEEVRDGDGEGYDTNPKSPDYYKKRTQEALDLINQYEDDYIIASQYRNTSQVYNSRKQQRIMDKALTAERAQSSKLLEEAQEEVNALIEQGELSSETEIVEDGVARKIKHDTNLALLHPSLTIPKENKKAERKRKKGLKQFFEGASKEEKDAKANWYASVTKVDEVKEYLDNLSAIETFENTLSELKKEYDVMTSSEFQRQIVQDAKDAEKAKEDAERKKENAEQFNKEQEEKKDKIEIQKEINNSKTSTTQEGSQGEGIENEGVGTTPITADNLAKKIIAKEKLTPEEEEYINKNPGVAEEVNKKILSHVDTTDLDGDDTGGIKVEEGVKYTKEDGKNDGADTKSTVKQKYEGEAHIQNVHEDYDAANEGHERIPIMEPATSVATRNIDFVVDANGKIKSTTNDLNPDFITDVLDPTKYKPGTKITLRVITDDNQVIPYKGEEVTWGSIKDNLTAEEKIDYVPIGVYDENGRRLGFVHHPAWITETNTKEIVDKEGITISDYQSQQQANRALREGILEKGGEAETTIRFKSSGPLHVDKDKKHIPASEALLSNKTTYAVVINGELVTAKDSEANLDNLEGIGYSEDNLPKNGSVVALVPAASTIETGDHAGKPMYYPVRLRPTRVSEKHVDSIMHAVEAFIAKKHTKATKELLENDKIDVLNYEGLTRYLRRFIYIAPNVQSKGFQEALTHFEEGQFLINIFQEGLEFGEGMGTGFQLWRKGEKGKTRKQSKFLKAFRSQLTKTPIHVWGSYGTERNFKLPLLTDDGVQVEFEGPYKDFIAQHYTTSVRSIDMGNGEYSNVANSLLVFDAKPVESRPTVPFEEKGEVDTEDTTETTQKPVKPTTSETDTNVEVQKADIEKRQRVADIITTQLELGGELTTVLETLAEQGYVEKINNATLFKQTTGRDAIVFNIDGAIVPIYRSSEGTDSKTKGKWYPFFFTAGDWLVKAGADSYKEGYNNPIIKQILDALNKNYTYDSPIATVEGDNNQLLSLIGLPNFDTSSENNNGIFDNKNYAAIALILKDWQSKLGNIDVSNYQKYLDRVSSALIETNPNLKSEIEKVFFEVSKLFAEIETSKEQTTETTREDFDPELVKQPGSNRVKTNSGNITILPNGEMRYDNGNLVTQQSVKNKAIAAQHLENGTGVVTSHGQKGKDPIDYVVAYEGEELKIYNTKNGNSLKPTSSTSAKILEKTDLSKIAPTAPVQETKEEAPSKSVKEIEREIELLEQEKKETIDPIQERINEIEEELKKATQEKTVDDVISKEVTGEELDGIAEEEGLENRGEAKEAVKEETLIQMNDKSRRKPKTLLQKAAAKVKKALLNIAVVATILNSASFGFNSNDKALTYDNAQVASLVSFEDVKLSQDEVNKLEDVNVITSFHEGSDDKYIIIDKNAGMAHLYQGDSLITTYEVGTGKEKGDALTETVERDGKVYWEEGNKTTGAGIYTVGSIWTYKSSPSYTLRDERGRKIPTVLHETNNNRRKLFEDNNPDNNRMSYGCVNFQAKSIQDLAKEHPEFTSGSKVYILPDNPNNKFKLVDNKLAFLSKDPNVNRSNVKYEADPIVVKAEGVNDKGKTFLTSLSESKKELMKLYPNVSNDEYNQILKVAYGIFGQESSFGTFGKVRGQVGRITDAGQIAANIIGIDRNPSLGVTQIRFTNVRDKVKEAFGITSQIDLLDVEKSAQATMAHLLDIYVNEIPSSLKDKATLLLPLAYSSHNTFSKYIETLDSDLLNNEYVIKINDTVDKVKVFLGINENREASKPSKAPESALGALGLVALLNRRRKGENVTDAEIEAKENELRDQLAALRNELGNKEKEFENRLREKRNQLEAAKKQEKAGIPISTPPPTKKGKKKKERTIRRRGKNVSLGNKKSKFSSISLDLAAFAEKIGDILIPGLRARTQQAIVDTLTYDTLVALTADENINTTIREANQEYYDDMKYNMDDYYNQSREAREEGDLEEAQETLEIAEGFAAIVNNWDTLLGMAEKKIKSTGLTKTSNKKKTQEHLSNLGENLKEALDEQKAEDTGSVDDVLFFDDDASFRIDTKRTVSAKLKRKLSFVEVVDEEGNPVEGPLGDAMYMPFDKVFSHLSGFLANIEPTHEDMMAELKEVSKGHAWVKQVINDFDYPGSQDSKEFQVAMSKHSADFITTIMEEREGRDGQKRYYYRITETNANSIARAVQASFMNDLKDSILFQESDGKYIVDDEVIEEYLEEYKELDKNNPAEVWEWFERSGIVLSNRTKETMETGLLRSGKVKLSWNMQFINAAGLFNVFVSNLRNRIGEDLDLSDDKIVNNSTFLTIAREEAKNNDVYFSNTFTSGENKTIYGYAPQRALSAKMRDLTNGKNLKMFEEMAQMGFHKHGDWFNELYNKDKNRFKDNTFTKNFKLEYTDTIKKFKDKKGTTGSNMTPLQQEAYRISLLQADSSTTEEGKFDDGGNPIKTRKGRFAFLTTSDKSGMPVIKATAHNTQFLDGKISEYSYEAVYRNVVLPEVQRILDTQKVGDLDIKGYDAAATNFWLFPELNTHDEFFSKNPKTGERGLLRGDILNNVELVKKLKQISREYVNAEVEAKKKEWVELGILELSEETGKIIKNTKYLDASYMKNIAGNNINYAVADFAINSLIANANMMMLFSSDPAFYFKSNQYKEVNKRNNTKHSRGELIAKGLYTKEDWVKEAEDLFINMGKRLAAEVAPGLDQADSYKNSYYNQAFLADPEMDSRIIDSYYKKLFKGDEGLLKDYRGIEIADAQEFTTLKEHVRVLQDQGMLTDEEMEEVQKVIDDPNKTLSESTLDILLQPMKPVGVHNVPTEANGQYVANRRIYIKSSSFPLIPELTKGLELDKLRVAMENQDIDRVAFGTAVKVGNVASPLSIFEKDGTIKDDIKFEKGKNYLNLSRKGFRIQQTVPYDPDKKNITDGSQQRKLLFSNILKIKGMDKLYKEYIDSYHSLFKLQYDNFNDEFVVDNRADLEKLKDLLLEEADSRNYGINEVKSLEIVKDKNGKFKFNFPIWGGAAYQKVEALLTAVVDNNIRKMKFRGHSYVLGTEAGFKTKVLSDDSKAAKALMKGSKMILTDKFTGELHPGGDGKPAQVILANFLKDDKGKLIDLRQFVNKDGILDTSKIDPEVLKMFGFRIPTQSQNSMASIEVVGFLPAVAGNDAKSDLIIAPRDFITRMGSDFDVDKLYTNQYWTSMKKGKLVKYDGKDQKKLLQNKLLDIHLEVMSNPDETIQKLINTPEGFGQLKQKNKDGDEIGLAKQINDLREKRAQEDNKGRKFTGLSSTYQRNKYLNARAGKSGVGVFSLDSTLNALLQTVPEEFPVILKAENVLFGSKKGITNLSQPYIIGGGRFKSDVISAFQSAAVDNENEQILDKLNINNETFGVIRTLALLGFEEDVITSFISQDVIHDYVNALISEKDRLTGYSANPELNAKRKVIKKYQDMVDTKYESKLHLKKADLSAEEMIKHIENGGKKDPLTQLAILEKFISLAEHGQDLQSLQSTINADSKGLGPSLIGTGVKQEQIIKLADSPIKNASKLIGNYNTEGKGVPVITETGSVLYIEPTTINGFASVYGVFTANKLWSEYFPYNKRGVTDVMRIIEHFSDTTDVNNIIKSRQSIWKDMLSYIYTKEFDGSMENRKRLFQDLKDKNPSIARKTKAAQEEFDNAFLNELAFDLNPNSADPSLIKYEASAAEDFDETHKYIAFADLILSPREIPGYEGYTTRDLADDLIEYAYLSGGIQEAIQFVKYVPFDYLTSMSLGKTLEAINFDTLAAFGGEYKMKGHTHELPGFIIQHFQNFPQRISAKVDKSSKGIKITDNVIYLNDMNQFEHMIQERTFDGRRSTDGIGNPILVPTPLLAVETDNNKFSIFLFDGQRYNRIDSVGSFGYKVYDAKVDGPIRISKTYIPSSTKSKATAVIKPKSTPTQPQSSGRKTYSGNVTSLKPNQVFVFGSNPEGRHGLGGAAQAKKFGLPMHQQRNDKNVGIMTKDLGPSYFKGNTPFKLETDANGEKYYNSGEYNFYKDRVVSTVTGETYMKDPNSNMMKGNWNMKMPKEVIVNEIKQFYDYAKGLGNKEFLVSDYSGKNNNGYTGQEMAEMFKAAGAIPSNVVFNENFDKLITPTQQAGVEGLNERLRSYGDAKVVLSDDFNKGTRPKGRLNAFKAGIITVADNLTTLADVNFNEFDFINNQDKKRLEALRPLAKELRKLNLEISSAATRTVSGEKRYAQLTNQLANEFVDTIGKYAEKQLGKTISSSQPTQQQTEVKKFKPKDKVIDSSYNVWEIISMEDYLKESKVKMRSGVKARFVTNVHPNEYQRSVRLNPDSTQYVKPGSVNTLGENTKVSLYVPTQQQTTQTESKEDLNKLFTIQPETFDVDEETAVTGKEEIDIKGKKKETPKPKTTTTPTLGLSYDPGFDPEADIDNLDLTGDIKEGDFPSQDLKTKFEEVLQNKEFIKGKTADGRIVPLDSGEEYVAYYNEKTGKTYQRTTEFTKTGEYTGGESPQIIGTKTDEFVRDFFDGTLKPLEEYDVADKRVLGGFIKQLEVLKKYFKENGNQQVLARDIVLYDDDLGIAGTVDLITYDDNGVVRIYDLKTMKGDFFRTTHKSGSNKGKNKYTTPYNKGEDSYEKAHQKQLSMYRILLNNTHGILAKELKIIPIEVNYKEGDTATKKLSFMQDQNGSLRMVVLDPLNKIKKAEISDIAPVPEKPQNKVPYTANQKPNNVRVEKTDVNGVKQKETRTGVNAIVKNENLTGDQKVEKLLDMISDRYDGKVNGAIAKVYKNILTSIREGETGFPPITFKVQNKVMLDGQSVKGLYSSSDNTITISGGLNKTQDAFLETVLHELTHAFTVAGLQKYFASSEVARFENSVNDFIKAANNHFSVLKKLNLKLTPANAKVKQIVTMLQSKQGLERVTEFAAYTMSDPDFQDYLKSLEYKEAPKGMWEKFTTFVKEMFNKFFNDGMGISLADKNFLSASLNNILTITDLKTFPVTGDVGFTGKFASVSLNINQFKVDKNLC